VFGRYRARLVVGVKLFIALARGITIVYSLVNDVYGFPSVKPDDRRDERVLASVAGSNIPTHALRIAQTVSPDFFVRSGTGNEGIVVRYAIPAVVADDAGIFVFVEVWNDAENLSYQCIQSLRILSYGEVHGLACHPVAHGDVEDTPIRGS